VEYVENSGDEHKSPAEADEPDDLGDLPIEQLDEPAKPTVDGDNTVAPPVPEPTAVVLAASTLDIDKLYWAEIQRAPFLEDGEDRRLTKRWREHGDIAARNKLIASHARLVHPIARDLKKRCPKHFQIEELIAAGNIGLVNAANGYDPGRNSVFASYAIAAITNAINDCIQRSSSIVKIGTKDKNPWWHGRDVSLHTPIYDKKTGEPTGELLQDILEDEGPGLEERVANAMALGDFREAAHALLDKRELRIFKARRFTDPPILLEELATEFGLTSERIRQIEEAAFAQVQEALNSGAFKPTRAARHVGGPPAWQDRPPECAACKVVDGVTLEWHDRLKRCEGWPRWRNSSQDYSIAIRAPSEGRDRLRVKELNQQAARRAPRHVIDIADKKYRVPITQTRIPRIAEWPLPPKKSKPKRRLVEPVSDGDGDDLPAAVDHALLGVQQPVPLNPVALAAEREWKARYRRGMRPEGTYLSGWTERHQARRKDDKLWQELGGLLREWPAILPMKVIFARDPIAEQQAEAGIHSNLPHVCPALLLKRHRWWWARWQVNPRYTECTGLYKDAEADRYAEKAALRREVGELVAAFFKRGGTVTRLTAFLKRNGTVVAPEGEYVLQPCRDCGVDTHKIREQYMVHDELWDRARKRAPRRAKKAHLCIGCLEARIGRELTPADFTDALCNSPKRAGNVMSLRLRARAGAPPWWHAVFFSKPIDFESLPVELRLLALSLPLPEPPAEFALAAE
jgi:RNA polymerase sigma-32 factor